MFYYFCRIFVQTSYFHIIAIMKSISGLLLAVLLLALPMSLPAGERGKREKDIYAYAYATNFKDSVVYLSAVQRIEGAVLEKGTAFLSGRNLYSSQFKNHVEVTQNVENLTSAIFFSTNKIDLEKKLKKITQRIAKGKTMLIKNIPAVEFTFVAAEKVDDGVRIVE